MSAILQKLWIAVGTVAVAYPLLLTMASAGQVAVFIYGESNLQHSHANVVSGVAGAGLILSLLALFGFRKPSGYFFTAPVVLFVVGIYAVLIYSHSLYYVPEERYMETLLKVKEFGTFKKGLGYISGCFYSDQVVKLYELVSDTLHVDFYRDTLKLFGIAKPFTHVVTSYIGAVLAGLQLFNVFLPKSQEKRDVDFLISAPDADATQEV